MTEPQPGDYTPAELRAELFGDGPDDVAAATAQLNQRIADSLRDVLDGTFAAFGFDWQPSGHRAVIAQQCRLKGEQQPGEGYVVDVVCGTFDALGFGYDRGRVRAEVERQVRGRS